MMRIVSNKNEDLLDVKKFNSVSLMVAVTKKLSVNRGIPEILSKVQPLMIKNIASEIRSIN